MKLLTFSSLRKHECLTKLSISMRLFFRFFLKSLSRLKLNLTKGYPETTANELWTSASGSLDNYVWCANSNFLDQATLNWKSGQPSVSDGNCVHVQLSNISAHLTTYAIGQCADKKNFICEVFK
jgi:hypothetical protein